MSDRKRRPPRVETRDVLVRGRRRDERAQARAGLAQDPARTRQGAAARRILVVDDDADMRRYLTRLLAGRWLVDVAGDGQAALDLARANRPDIVLSDVMMPRMDGVALLKALRSEAATRDVPVILLSARAGEESVLEGLETGADDYLVKPFSARELLARVRTHLDMACLRREWAIELETFSYSVSHDLRAPLRTIDGFTKALLQEDGHLLSPEGRRYVDLTLKASRRMTLLIDDLLKLSRVSRSELDLGDVDLTGTARKVLSGLRALDKDRAVETLVQDGLSARADARLLTVVFENLLGNAWKFTSKRDEALIEVGQERLDGRRTFYVRDNGAGFDMAYAGRLFTPFQRLHSETEFEGTGIGLATVHRIVTRHGGSVWVEAAPGAGATFRFTLEQ